MVNLSLTLGQNQVEAIGNEASSQAITESGLMGIGNLPNEVIQDILVRLPITSFFVCKYVCPEWNGLIKNSHAASMQATKGQSITSLIMCSTSECETYFVADIDASNKAVKLKNMPLKSWLPTYKIVGSCNGFVCFANDTLDYRSIFVCNPITGEQTLLPDNSKHGKVLGYNYGFGFDSKNKEYKVVRMCFNNDPLFEYEYPHLDELIEDLQEFALEVQVHTLGTSSWRTIGQMLLPVESGGYASSATLLNGCLHWFGVPPIFDDMEDGEDFFTRVVVVSLAEEDMRYFRLPPLGGIQNQIHLGVLGGDLVIVDDGYTERVDLWVMKKYGIEESWTKDFVIDRPMGPELYFGGRAAVSFRILLLQENGQILVEYNHSRLLFYDPKSRLYKDLNIVGLPNNFRAVPHVPTLVPLNHIFEDV